MITGKLLFIFMRKSKDEIGKIKEEKVRWKNALRKFPDFNMLAVGKIGSG